MPNDLLGALGSQITTAIGNANPQATSTNSLFDGGIGARLTAAVRQERPNWGLGNIFGRLSNQQNNNNPTTPAPANDASGMTEQEKAFQAFRNSTGYKFRMEQGTDALNAQYAARGMLESGAAEKAMQEYAQNFASNEFANYMGMLGNQQSLGATAASSAAGVGANFGNSMANLNSNFANAASGLNTGYANGITNINNNLANAQGSYAQNVGNAYSNQAIANANNTNAMIGGIGSSIGSAIGAFAYRPYGS